MSSWWTYNMPKYQLNEYVMTTTHSSIGNGWNGKLCQVIAIDESLAHAANPYLLKLQSVDAYGRVGAESWFRSAYIAKIDEKEYEVEL
jgi:hypothetical protein